MMPSNAVRMYSFPSANNSKSIKLKSYPEGSSTSNNLPIVTPFIISNNNNDVAL